MIRVRVRVRISVRIRVRVRVRVSVNSIIRETPPCKECVCIRVKRRFQQFFGHITTVSGCGRELNAHFYNAASLKYHVPDT